MQPIDCFVLVQISLNPLWFQSGYQVLTAEPIFIDPGVKITGAYYRDVLLGEHLLSDIKELSGSEFFIFQLDSAPADRARETVDLLSRDTPDFISLTIWPPNSPDLNSVDCKIWSVLPERVYQTRIRNVDLSNSDVWRMESF